jgi:hypothetical protein
MSNASKAKHYYQKTTDSLLSMEHFQIADLFAATKSPVLEVRKTLSREGNSDAIYAEYELSFWIKNDGVISAEQPFVWIAHPLGTPISNVHPFSHTSAKFMDKRTKLYCPPTFILFPDEEICLAKLRTYSVGNEFYMGSSPSNYVNEKGRRVGEMKIGIVYGAKNAYRKEIMFDINDEFLLKETRGL